MHSLQLSDDNDTPHCVVYDNNMGKIHSDTVCNVYIAKRFFLCNLSQQPHVSGFFMN